MSADLEQELTRVPDVLAARVFDGDASRPLQVHVLATPGRGQDDLVRDVRSVAATLHGVDLDPTSVHVVQMETAGAEREVAEVASADGPATPARPVVENVVVARGARHGRAAVTLRTGGRAATGDARCTNVTSSIHRAVAEAALAALLELHGSTLDVVVDAALVVPLAPRQLAVVTLTALAGTGEEQLVGATLVAADGVHDALVRSVLDATNRRIQRLQESPT